MEGTSTSTSTNPQRALLYRSTSTPITESETVELESIQQLPSTFRHTVTQTLSRELSRMTIAESKSIRDAYDPVEAALFRIQNQNLTYHKHCRVLTERVQLRTYTIFRHEDNFDALNSYVQRICKSTSNVAKLQDELVLHPKPAIDKGNRDRFLK